MDESQLKIGQVRPVDLQKRLLSKDFPEAAFETYYDDKKIDLKTIERRKNSEVFTRNHK